MLALKKLQYKQCLRVLTLPKRNVKFIDQICTIHRPEKSVKWYNDTIY